MFWEIQEHEEVCANCKHFYQHYVYSRLCRNGFTASNFGHCVYPRSKNRRPGSDACDKFERRCEE